MGLDGGGELTVSPGALVTLTASNGGSGATTSTSYTWTQVFGPPVDFGDGLGESISFIAPTPPRQDPILLSFEILIVSDGLEALHTLNVTVDPALAEGEILYSEVEDNPSGTEGSSDGGPPGGDTDENASPPSDDPADGESDSTAPLLADAGSDLLVESGSVVMLDGSGSSDPNALPLTYHWAQESGSTVELLDSENVHAWFLAPAPPTDSQLTFLLTVNNGSASATDAVVVVVQATFEGASAGPTADAGPNQEVAEGGDVSLDGRNSAASGGGFLIFSWLQMAGPPVELSGATEAVAEFVAPPVETEGAVLIFELTVTADGLSAVDLVEIAVTDADVGGDEDEDDEYEPVLPPGTNIALGLACTFTMEPNYGLTTGSSDPQDLTDGEVYTGGGTLWTFVGAVGWSYPDGPVGIHLDLGDLYALDAIALDTVGGAGGVYMPGAALVYASDDGVNWQYMTNLMTQGVLQTEYVQHRFEKSGLPARGRYLAVYLLTSASTLIVVDELEVLTGDFDPQGVEPDGVGVESAQLPDDVMNRFPFAVEQTASLHLVTQAEAALTAVSGGDWDGALAQLADVRASILELNTAYGVDRRDGLPYTPMDEQTCAIVGQYMAGAGRPTVDVWFHSLASGSPRPFDRPSGAEVPWSPVGMMTNEHAHASFCVSNNTDQTVTVDLAVSDASSPPTVRLREGFYVLGPGYQFIADALPEITSGSLVLPPGMTKEVWLDIDSKDALAQDHEREIWVTPSPGTPVTLNLTIEVFATVMPDDPAYRSLAFSYLDFVDEYREAAALDLSEHYTNIQTLSAEDIPFPYIDSSGEPVLPLNLDFGAMDAALDLRPDVQLWLLITGIPTRTPGELIDGGTPEDEAAFQEWVTAIRDHLAERGLDKDRWAFFWADEPSLTEWYDYIVPASAWTRQADPEILICQNWNTSDVEDAVLSTPDVLDIFMPTTSRMNANTDQLLELLASPGHTGWKYDSISSPARDPHRWYRLSHWDAWNWGLEADGKWVYLDNNHGRDVWNDYDTTVWGMAYPGVDAPIPSKRWEAWRDGIEDYELMQQLAQAAEATGDPVLIDLLDVVPQAVLDNPDDSAVLEALRLTILQALDD